MYSNSTTRRLLRFVSDRLTIKVEEVIVLVDMWPSICSSSYWADVVFQTPALLLASRLAPVPINVQGCPTCWTRGVLLEPRAQTRAGKTHTYTQSTKVIMTFLHKKNDCHFRAQNKYSVLNIRIILLKLKEG